MKKLSLKKVTLSTLDKDSMSNLKGGTAILPVATEDPGDCIDPTNGCWPLSNICPTAGCPSNGCYSNYCPTHYNCNSQFQLQCVPE